MTMLCMLSRFSHVRLCMTLWTATHQAPPSTGFSRQEYWSGLPFLSPAWCSSSGCTPWSLRSLSKDWLLRQALETTQSVLFNNLIKSVSKERSREAKYSKERAEGLPSQRAGIREPEPEANVSFIPRDIT